MSTIAVVCYSSFGGSGVVASELAIGLAKRGHRVHLLTSGPPDRTLPRCDRLILHAVDAADHPLFAGRTPIAIAVASRLVDVARSERLDLVHAHYAMPHAVSALLARQAIGAAAPKLVTSLHGTDVTGIGADPSYQPIVRHAVLSSDAITVPSAYLAERARAWLGGEARAIEIIPNFVDTTRFVPAPKSASPLLFHVSNFRPVKRVRDLAEVLLRVRSAGVAARLVLVGDGPDRAALEAHVRALGLSEAVQFLGKTDDFASKLASADAFVSTSETESFGLAALEAMSAGVPVFGYKVGGLPEVVDQTVGRLVPAFDVDALAAALTTALRDRGTLASMGQHARARAVAQFHVEPAIDRYEEMLMQVLA